MRHVTSSYINALQRAVTFVAEKSFNLACAMTSGEENVVKNLTMGSSPSSSSFSGPSSSDSAPFAFQAMNYQPEDQAQSLINFKGGYADFMQGNGSLLSFQHAFQSGDGNYSIWEGNPRTVEDFNSFETASSFGQAKGSHGDWLYSDATIISDTVQESGSPETIGTKRPYTGESMQALKKQSSSSAANNKKQKSKSCPSKDPQSIAAKNRRERISERLKTLQELVPNGSKVDLVTMLEKAISYVKFLQVQVKVLATDEFWPVHGGKAPDISQVKEVIDAILSSSQRERNSSSKQ